MAGPKNNHPWHDSFEGVEPNPPGPVKQPTPAKTINGADPKNGPRLAKSPAPDTYCE